MGNSGVFEGEGARVVQSSRVLVGEWQGEVNEPVLTLDKRETRIRQTEIDDIQQKGRDRVW